MDSDQEKDIDTEPEGGKGAQDDHNQEVKMVFNHISGIAGLGGRGRPVRGRDQEGVERAVVDVPDAVVLLVDVGVLAREEQVPNCR